MGGDVDGGAVGGVEHHLVEEGVLGILRRGGEVDHGVVGRARPLHEDGSAGALLQRHPGAAEGPAGSRGHVDLDALTGGLLLRVAQHLHPLVAEVGDVAGVVALNAVDGGDLHGSDAVTGVLVQIPLQV